MCKAKKQTDHSEDALELRREISIEKLGGDVSVTGVVRRTIKRQVELDGLLIEENCVEHARLSCGHLSPASGAGICVCGRSLCPSCLEKGSVCSVCSRVLGPCCTRNSLLDPDRVYCPKHSALGWLHWIFGG